MGNWNITIRGVGVHHNKKLQKDANRMAAKFVHELREAGHHIVSASFTHGGEDDISSGQTYIEARDKVEES
ncbi:MAG TPA: hypothetical protein VIE65_00735 [Methylobacter sp.]|jgi:hypothetical protein